MGVDLRGVRPSYQKDAIGVSRKKKNKDMGGQLGAQTIRRTAKSGHVMRRVPVPARETNRLRSFFAHEQWWIVDRI